MKPERIHAYLSPGVPRDVRVFDMLPSTNTALHELAREGAADGCCLIAEGQTSGHGRLGRPFASPSGGGLYMSLLLRREIPAACVPLLTPYAALVAARAVEELTGLSVGIKWVNDLRVGDAKIAGILTEGELSPSGALAFAIVGFGINLLSGALPPSLLGIAAAIGDFCPPPSAEALAGNLIDLFYTSLPTLCDGTFLAEYRARSVVLGRRVSATLPEGELIGVAESIADDGALLVRTEAGVRPIRVGEISIKM